MDLNILDENNRIISHLLFGAMYTLNSSKKTIKILCENKLSNITITPVALNPDQIPESMQDSSADSDSYFGLSLNNSDFYNVLNISSLEANTPIEIYVLCAIPGNINGGTFMAGIEVIGQTL